MARKTILYILFLIAVSFTAKATHIVGGSMSLKWNNGNSYTLTLKVLRDCYNAATGAVFDGGSFNNECVVGMYEKGSNKLMKTFNMGSATITKLKISGPNCAETPDQCTQLGIYKLTAQFNPATYPNANGYYFAYQRCCRNSIIQNIQNQSDAAIAIYLEVPAFSMHNSTPEFSANPFTYLCKDNPFKYNFNFTEPDGDDLKYSVVTPLNGTAAKGNPQYNSSNNQPLSGPYSSITWGPTYTDTNQVKGAPSMKIDESTGDVTMTPNEQGVFVAAFKIEEYRANVKISECRLELQFNITVCLSNPFPVPYVKNMDGTKPANGRLSVTIPDTLCFKIGAKDLGDSLFFKVSGLAFTNPFLKNKPTIDSPFAFSSKDSGSTTFCWKTDCSLTGMFDQLFTLEVTDNGCPLSKSSHINFKVHIDSMPNQRPTIRFTDLAGIQDTNYHEITVRDSICFNIVVDDPEDTIDMELSGGPLDIPGSQNKPTVSPSLKQQTYLNGQYNFCWRTDCSLSDAPIQEFQVSVKDRGCVSTPVYAPFYIKFKPYPIVNPTDLLCMTLMSDNVTRVDFGDSTINDTNYLIHHIYRSFNKGPFLLYDSITSRIVKGTYIDNHSIKNRENDYEYFMRAVNVCGFEGPPSDTSGTGSNQKPTPDIQKLITVTVEDNEFVRVIWPKTWESDFARYFLYRSIRGTENYLPVADYHVSSDTFFDDHHTNVQENSYCYYLMMKDTCQNLSPLGPPSCSILLKGNSIPYESQMYWTPYNYWDLGTKSYSVFKEDNVSPYAWYHNTTSIDTTMSDDQLNRKAGRFNYYVIANQNGAATLAGSEVPVFPYSKSNAIELIQPPLLHVPNAFTPNQDGTNDLWDLRDVFVKDFELKVFDRWGRLVFETNDKNVQWKGEVADDKFAPDNVYVYLVYYTGWDDSIHSLKGNVTVLR